MMKYCVVLMFLTAVACEPFVKEKSKSGDEGLNAPSPSEQIANENRDKLNESTSKVVTSGNIRFTVQSKGDANLRSLKLAAVNLKGDTTKADSIEIHDIKGFLKDVQVADLDKDGNPEVYCFTQSKGTEMSGSVYGIAYLNGKSVTIQPGTINQVDAKGYQGQDSFYVQAPYIMRTYPVFKEGDVASAPTGGKATIKYKLEKYTLIETK